MRPRFEFRIIDENDTLNEMKNAWDGLLAESASNGLFLSWEWMSVWWRHFRNNRRLNVIEVRDGRDLVAILPLCAVSGRIEFLGTGSVGSDYLDLIIRNGRDSSVHTAIARYLEQTGLVMRFTHLPDNSTIHQVAAGMEKNGSRIMKRESGVCPFLRFDGVSWETFVSSLGQSHRENVRRRIRKLEERGATFELAETEADRCRNLRILFDLHNKCWRDRGGSDGLHTAELISFHEEFSRLAFERGWLRLFVLRVDGNPVAAVYGFLVNGTFYFYQSGFDPGCREWSVGLVALAMSIRHAIGEKAAEYDFLHGSEEYKFRWARTTRKLWCLDVYPHSFSGSIALHANRAVRATRRMARYVIPRTW
ncbi:MAG TPA: GNAT family N-acetyltransferase [Terriglobia bacterium]|nr:GNAT family N-acetyltransferase [Terriglobia bacterium]